MSRFLGLSLIILFLSISPGFCSEVGYVFDVVGGHPLENASISEFNTSDKVTFTSAGPGTPCSIEKNVGDLQNVFDQRVEPDPVHRDVVDIVESEGACTIDQVCHIYSYLTKSWKYVSDPRCEDYFQYANESLQHGRKAIPSCAGAGDCDDFAILMASMIESIGGTSRIILANGPEASHAYAEVYLGNILKDNSIKQIINWIMFKYSIKEVVTHRDLNTGDVWLNLDWGEDIHKAAYPGYKLFTAKEHIPLYIKYNTTKTILNPSPIASFTYNPSGKSTAREPIIFNAIQSNELDSINQYNWKFGDNTSITTRNASVGHIYSKGGTFLVNLTVTDVLGFNSSTSFKNININNPPVANFTYSPLKPKEGDTIRFNASPSYDIDGRIVDYYWSFDNVDFSKCQIYEHKYTECGRFLVNLTVTDDNGIKNTSSRFILINKPPIANFTYDLQIPNPGDDVIFDASSSNDSDGSIKDYRWDFGDNSELEGSKVSHKFTNGGNFPVRLTVKDNDDAIGTFSSEVKVNYPPIAAFTYSPKDPKLGVPVTFYAERSIDRDGKISSYEWDFGDDTSSVKKPKNIINHTYQGTGDFDVSLFVTDDKNAMNSSTLRVKVRKSGQNPEIAPPNVTTPDHLTSESKLGIGINTVNELEVRGQVTNVGVPEFTWTNSSFAGFYYDIDKNLGAEMMTFRLSNATATGATLSDQPNADNNRGVSYVTKAQPKCFKFKPWGQYEVIAFLGERYFAAYDSAITQGMVDAEQNMALLCSLSAYHSRNLMDNKQIDKILKDDNTEITMTSAYPLELKEGYQLGIKSVDIDGNKASFELSRYGEILDVMHLRPSIDNATMSDKTYYYNADLGDAKGIVQIAVHFKNVFRGANEDIATVDGIFQISDTVAQLKSEQQYDKLSIRNVNATLMSITMDNKDNQIRLGRGRDIILAQNLHIRTADQYGTATNPLRYYIYKTITDPGTYMLRGTVANLSSESFNWTNSTFPGFYYDIDKNLGTEQLTFYLTKVDQNKSIATLSDQPESNNADGNLVRGVVYTTKAQSKDFRFEPWGRYDIVGFMANKYFAGYNSNTTFTGMFNAINNGELRKVLLDNDDETTITTGSVLPLDEGYELRIKQVDLNENKVYLVLAKDGIEIDSRVVSPSSAEFNTSNYVYMMEMGSAGNVPLIVAHLQAVFRGTEADLVTIDGLFQLSDLPTPIRVNQEYDKMSIREVDPATRTITMDNKDNQITLSRNKDVVLMQDIHIKTADQVGTADAPLRYCIYKAATIEATSIPTVKPSK